MLYLHFTQEGARHYRTNPGTFLDENVYHSVANLIHYFYIIDEDPNRSLTQIQIRTCHYTKPKKICVLIPGKYQCHINDLSFQVMLPTETAVGWNMLIDKISLSEEEKAKRERITQTFPVSSILQPA